MLGGAEGNSGIAPSNESSWINLFNDFSTFYPVLKQFLIDWDADGIDLDIEEPSQWTSDTSNYDNVVMLIEQLHADFGDNFLIVFAPVADAIFLDDPNGGLSGFDYKKLMNSSYGQYVSWLNLQFYNGFGTLDSSYEYSLAIDRQGYDPSLLVAGMEYCTDATSEVDNTIEQLANTYSNFGGVDVWKGNDTDILEWSETMYDLMNNNNNSNDDGKDKKVKKRKKYQKITYQ